MIPKLACLILMFTAVLLGCNSCGSNVAHASESFSLRNQKQTFFYNQLKIKMQERLYENEMVISALKIHSKKLKKEERSMLQNSISELNQKNELLKLKVSLYQEKGLSKWTTFENELTQDLDKLAASITDLTKNNY